jgi:hypothetical protein
MYQVQFPDDIKNYADLNELKSAFGAASSYTEDSDGNYMIRHPLNPHMPIIATRIKN